VFMTVAGEEQGLIGSRAHAKRMKEREGARPGALQQRHRR
jgi:Zn-dependent M28 family amino/carboxypeptidase